MSRFIDLPTALWAHRRAVTALEYGIIAGIIVVTVAMGFTSLADVVSDRFVGIGASL